MTQTSSRWPAPCVNRLMIFVAIATLLAVHMDRCLADEVNTGNDAGNQQNFSSFARGENRLPNPIHSKEWQQWFPEEQCWFDVKQKVVIVDGQICQRKALLEMFACPAGTKDHESIVAVNCRAATIHAYLLAIGAQAGSPVRYEPEYAPATGTEIEIFVYWTDEEGTDHHCNAQQLVRNVKTGEAIKSPWVFAGSRFWKDKDGKEHYLAESGDLICVSNFPTATLDLPVRSSQANEELLYEPFTERIPPRKTKTRLVLKPKWNPAN